jgi:hypothetical protein
MAHAEICQPEIATLTQTRHQQHLSPKRIRYQTPTSQHHILQERLGLLHGRKGITFYARKLNANTITREMAGRGGEDSITDTNLGVERLATWAMELIREDE